MTASTLPKKPTENWEQVRDDWIAAVELLVQNAETWAQKHEWATRRDPKTITEEELGRYTVPRLLIHAPEGRVVMVPVARYVIGALGLVDLCVLPSYDSLRIVRTADGWQLWSGVPDEPRRPWTEEAFAETMRQLLEIGG